MKQAIKLLLFLLCVGAYETGHAYRPDTHRAIAEQAAKPEVSHVDQILKDELGIPDGIDSIFKEKTLQKWLGEGAALEDWPPSRVTHHFHNPFMPWESAGKTLLLGSQSSIVWQQSAEQLSSLDAWGVGLERGWPSARRYYEQALTAGAPTDREQWFAETFRTLGNAVHLIQDASVPAHTRDDAHIVVGPDKDPYERWAEYARLGEETDICSTGGLHCFFAFLNQSPDYPAEELLTAPYANSLAPVPIARLIDSDTYTGALVPSLLTGFNIGLAEYSNANFVSADTIFTDFPLPRTEGLGAGTFEPEEGGYRRYFPKLATDGEPVQRFVAEGVWYERLEQNQTPPLRGGYVLTNKVHEGYARKLLPRAVGYSAGLINYFFRGKIAVVDDSQNPGSRVIKNEGSELLKGTFTLYYDDVDGKRHPVDPDPNDSTKAKPWPTPEAGLAKDQTMPLPALAPPSVPAPKTPGEYMLVFQGDMGEEKAIAVAARKINLPTSFLLYTSLGTYRPRPYHEWNTFGRRWLGEIGRWWVGILGDGVLCARPPLA